MGNVVLTNKEGKVFNFGSEEWSEKPSLQSLLPVRWVIEAGWDAILGNEEIEALDGVSFNSIYITKIIITRVINGEIDEYTFI